MDVTLLGITVFIQPAINVLEDLSIIALQLLRESYFVFPLETVIEVKPLQRENAPEPMVVTLLGMVMLVRLEQPSNAPEPMVVTLLGMVTLVRLEQPLNAPEPMVVTLLGMVMLVRPVHPRNASV